MSTSNLVRLQTCDSKPQHTNWEKNVEKETVRRFNSSDPILAVPSPKLKRTRSCGPDLHREGWKSLPIGIRATKGRRSISEGIKADPVKTNTVSADVTKSTQQEKYSIAIQGEIVKRGEVIVGGQAKPEVYLVVSSSGPQKAVVGKTFLSVDNPPDNAAQENYERELSILKAVGPHPGIVGLLDHDIIGAPKTTLFLDYHSSGDLMSWANEMQPLWVPEVALWKILYQMGSALAFLHYGKGTPDYDLAAPYERPFFSIHRDIKLENTLVAGPKLSWYENSAIREADFKLCDFALARKIDRDCREIPRLIGGTPESKAPEAGHFPYLANPRTDIFELGATLHSVITGRDPLQTPCNNRCDEMCGMAAPTFQGLQTAFREETIRKLRKGYSKRLLDTIGNIWQ